MDNEQPHQELVKCVVVGDTAVGKTRLICARACNAKLTLSQLMTTHIPTVWAIDQYRIYKEVLERSWEVVDNVSVSLRLWDTFGDHDKDRRFAYGRSDVVLLCFSVANPISLKNCKVVWYPEIRKFCPNTPIVLVGCKNDLRYMYRDEQFLSLCRDRSPFFRGNHPCVSSRFPEFGRPLRESDILTPEQGRLVAKELDAPYYETSVLTHYGVNEVFENVIRCALLYRRQQRFWMTNLKHVQRPLLQVPFCPPKPPPPKHVVPPSHFKEDMVELFGSKVYTDVIFLLGNIGLPACKAILAATSQTFYKLFTMDLSSSILASGRSSSEASMASSLDAPMGNFNMDTEQLLKDTSKCAPFRLLQGFQENKEVSQNSSGNSSPTSSCAPNFGWKRGNSQIHPEATQILPLINNGNVRPKVHRQLNHPAFKSISIEQCEGLDHRGDLLSSVQDVVTVVDSISAKAFYQCLRFLYTGSVEISACHLAELQHAAELLDIPDLLVYISNVQDGDEFLNPELQNKHIKKLQETLRPVCITQGLFSDVLFQLENGTCAAHRPILMARCEVMAAMFRGDFRESSAKTVHFPGVTRECFHQFLVYLYTDEIDNSVIPGNCLELLELANRLCMQHLLMKAECKVLSELHRMSDKGIDVTEYSLKLLEPCQVHNADQLADWCLHNISVNYNEICYKFPKLLRRLHPENQAYLNRNRWPPVWYLKEFDYYERCLRERQQQAKPPKGLKRFYSTSGSGCLCFSGKNRRSEGKSYSFSV